ncbi:nuclear transport factor 2 family protein [Micromonospora cathayae]|uniref:Nuclear transport factor 2 family protein n=1 Tax=Micromonospora cathayae TaxID=3028804 RepID=A0ABY7ZL20_9ACTN|nr:nuclear transport factor 2 family protein [Micromonospora sp. HUAS 3]WDZ83692.1 nuclear transport factor 2 family protein [Micromonospora sp. HUAS 3]
MTRAVRAGMDFVSALDRGSLGGLARLCAPGATWWVDTGPDRRGGDPDLAPTGSGRFPLHGVLRMDDKLALMRDLGPTAFPTGCRQIPRRIVAGDDWCVIEVEGYGVHASGLEYANRYGFVFDVDPSGAVVSVREYLDTIHAQQVVGGGEPVPRSSLDAPAARPDRYPGPDEPAARPAPDPGDAPPAVTTALAMWPALAGGDLDAFGALFTEDATWWTDTGRNRDLGRPHRRGDIDANGPFHGTVTITAKLAAMRARLATGGYRSAAVTVTPHRWIADDTLVAVEASGDATLADGSRYQNRYLWVVDVRADGIAGVREYCDTLHIADLMGYHAEVGR